MSGRRQAAASEAMAVRMRRQRRVMQAVNMVMRRLLALPFPTPLSSRLMLVTLTGRQSGRLYRQPVSYIADSGALLTPGGGRWARNLVAGRPVQVRIAGRDRTVRPELITDRGEVGRLLDKVLASNPRARSFMPFIGPDGVADQGALDLALRHGFCIVRWHFDEPSSGTRR
jgi:deazaflavin-dependent oxidoreductase (nitroreductase family)